ncbi:MAG: hypothetical protein FWF41_02620 [Betaproteobacteria bacterium]|nr:hypothetical protein [Betaproteobacteria bacterium]
MDKLEEIIALVAQKTGIDPQTCTTVVQALEKELGGALGGLLSGGLSGMLGKELGGESTGSSSAAPGASGSALDVVGEISHVLDMFKK